MGQGIKVKFKWVLYHRQSVFLNFVLFLFQWEYEKWKYEKDGQVVLYSVMTGKALKLNKDLSVDSVGEEKDTNG